MTDTVRRNVCHYFIMITFSISGMLLIRRTQMTVNSGLNFPSISGVEHGEIGASPDGLITHRHVRVTEVRPRHLVCL